MSRIKYYDKGTSTWKYADVGSGQSNFPEKNMTENTAEIKPNIFYKWNEVASLNLTLATAIPNIVNEYIFEFKSGSVPTTLSLPSDIKWANSNTIEANKTYQVSIVNGLGVIASA